MNRTDWRMAVLFGLVFADIHAGEAQSVKQLYKKAGKTAQVSLDLAKQLDKVDSYYQYKEIVKRVPRANFGLFLRLNFFRQMQLPAPTSRGMPVVSPFLDKLSLQTGLEVTGKGGKYDDGSGGVTRVRLTYLQLPIHLLYETKLPNDHAVFAGLGPYFAYGLGGRVKGDNFSSNAFDNPNGYRRFDAGLSLTAGYWFTERVVANLRYDLGLANLSRDGGFEKVTNRIIGLNVGYAIGFAN